MASVKTTLLKLIRSRQLFSKVRIVISFYKGAGLDGLSDCSDRTEHYNEIHLI